MAFKKFGIILFLIFLLIPAGKILAQTTNAGFVPSNIWYSKDPFVEGDNIKIYTLIFNPDTRKFTGTVDFFDNSTLLGKKDFSIVGTSTKDISINWTVTAGNHQIFGQIENAKFITASGASVTANLTDKKTSTSSRTVSSKIVAQNITNGLNSVDGALNSTLNSIPTPAINTITTATNSLNGFINNASATFQKAQTDTQKNIDALNDVKNSPKNTKSANVLQKPFEYVKLFIFTILAYIFENKILFYGILVVIALLILRYIWNLIF
jgi:hypothetical protein